MPFWLLLFPLFLGIFTSCEDEIKKDTGVCITGWIERGYDPRAAAIRCE